MLNNRQLPLGADSTLANLASHDAQVEGTTPGRLVADMFDARQDLPGVIVRSQDGSAQVISRHTFFRQMSQPFSREVYLNRQIWLFFELHRAVPPLLLASDTRISDAARAALKRAPAIVYEPVLVRRADGEHRLLDVHELLLAQTELLAEAEVARAQSEKLASLGQIAAGVAHEINNPLAFVSNNVAVVQRDLRAICELLELYSQADRLILEHVPPLYERIGELAERIDLPYTLQNLPDILSRSREGLRRIERIVCDLRAFVGLDESEYDEVDINAGIVSTVQIVKGRAKDRRVSIVLDLRPLPPVACYPAKINQVVMNLLANGIDACVGGGHVIIVTRPEESAVCISVQDTGTGIDPSIRGRIFDPFFTTKPVGAGTGLGLSISYGIIRDHNGRIDLETAPGLGSTFRVYLPTRKPQLPRGSNEPATEIGVEA